MAQTLLQVKNLEKFIKKHGEDPFISQTISKMLSYKIQKYEEEIERLKRELKMFEQTYKKESSIFFKEFNLGKLGDNMDFIEWSSLYQMRNRLLEKKSELDLDRGTRKKIIDTVLSNYGIKNLEGELITEVPDNQFGDALYSYLQGLIKITE